MNTLSKKILYIIPTMVFIFLISASIANASNVYGSAWSEGVGWISFNSCSNPSNCSSSGVPSHGVTLDINTDTVSGTAWNYNIGLISFNPSDWGACPPDMGSCGSFVNTWGVGGWARALSPKSGSNTGGWDGWISLGKNGVYNANIDKNTALSISTAGFSSNSVFSIDSGSNGYWWGSNVVGWIDLNPSGGSPYDINKGGVFVTNLEQDLVLNGPAYVVAGNKASFSWQAKNGFTPNSCTRMSNPGGSNWDSASYSVGVTEDTISNIEIPHDNNAESTQTEFTLECTDSITTQQAIWTVIATKFHPEVSVAFSCIAKNANPTLDILNIDDASSPSCDVYADKPTSSRFVGTTTTNSITDTNFSGENTNYTMECTNGATNTAIYTTPSPKLVEICTPYFTVSGSTRCGTTQFNERYGGVFQKIGNDYIASLELTANSIFGFDDEPIAISSSYNNLAFSPNNFSLNGNPEYNTSTATYTINEADYITATNNGEDPIVVPLTFSPASKYSFTLNFCPVGSGSTKIKPVYKPF